MIESYPHNKEALFLEPIFLPTAATKALPAATLDKLRGFQSAVLFTLWKVSVRLSVVEGFVKATASLQKLVSVATLLKRLKALCGAYTCPAAQLITQHEAAVLAVRQLALKKQRAGSGPLQHAASAPTSPRAVRSVQSYALPLATGGGSPTPPQRAASTPHAGTSTGGTPAALLVLLLRDIDGALRELDAQLEQLRSAAGPLQAGAGEETARTHALLGAARQVLVGRRHAYSDMPAAERARVAAGVRRAARTGKIALLRTLNDFGLHELRLHLSRTRERLRASGGATDLAGTIEFACVLRDLAACVAERARANSNDGALGRVRDKRSTFRASLVGRLVELAARLHAEWRQATFYRREAAHFRELEAAVVDANARAQVFGVAVRALKAKMRALTQQQYHAQLNSDAGPAEDVDINVLELEILELTVQLDQRAAAVRGSQPDALLQIEHADEAAAAVAACVGAFRAQAPHYVGELGALLHTRAECDEAARVVTDALFPDLLLSTPELTLLRALGPSLQRAAAAAAQPADVLPLSGHSFAHCLLQRYGQRRASRAYAALVLRETLVALCADARLDDTAQLSASAAQRLQQHCRSVLERLMRTLDQAPVGVRWLAREAVAAMRQRFPAEAARGAAEALAARFVFGALLGPAALYPDLYGVFKMDEMPRTRDNLTLFSRALSHIGSGTALPPELAPLQTFVEQVAPAVAKYVAKLADVGDLAAYLDYPHRPPPHDVGHLARRAAPVHVLRPRDLEPLTRLLAPSRNALRAPSPAAAVDAAFVRALGALHALPRAAALVPLAVEAVPVGASASVRRHARRSRCCSRCPTQQRRRLPSCRRPP